jgi:hypothetical protein
VGKVCIVFSHREIYAYTGEECDMGKPELKQLSNMTCEGKVMKA